jgi:hypothetical protein
MYGFMDVKGKRGERGKKEDEACFWGFFGVRERSRDREKGRNETSLVFLAPSRVVRGWGLLDEWLN